MRHDLGRGVRCPEREYAVYRAVYDGRGAFFLAGLVLLPVISVLDRKGWSQNRPVTGAEKKKQLLSGMICGVLLFAATTLQQFGLLDTTVGNPAS